MAELAEFRQSYFDDYWDSRPLKRAERRAGERVHVIAPLLSHRTGRLLDVGCGPGLFASAMSRLGYDVLAVDISRRAVDMARSRGIRANCLDLERETPESRYDVISCLEVLQQMSDPADVLGRLAGRLEKGGELVISLPNEYHAVRRLGLAGRGRIGDQEPSHRHLFTPETAERLVTSCGLEVHRRAWTSLVPPHYGALARFGRSLVPLWPAGLALSTIFVARRGNES